MVVPFFQGKTKWKQQLILIKLFIYFRVKSLPLKNLVDAIIYKANDNDDYTLENYFLLCVEIHYSKMFFGTEF